MRVAFISTILNHPWGGADTLWTNAAEAAQRRGNELLISVSPAVAQEFAPPGPHVFVRCVAHWHPWDKIRLMSLCEHIAIANSTFYWWAAWLNPRTDKMVIAPDPWFAQSDLDQSTIIPESWIRINRD